jgi:hypothetical protein
MKVRARALLLWLLAGLSLSASVKPLPLFDSTIIEMDGEQDATSRRKLAADASASPLHQASLHLEGISDSHDYLRIHRFDLFFVWVCGVRRRHLYFAQRQQTATREARCAVTLLLGLFFMGQP